MSKGLAALLVRAALLASLTLEACAPASPPPARPTAAPPNVVLVVVDTLRADHLGAYGYDRPTSPRLDRLAARSALFTDARAQAPCTFPSVDSLLTSRPPWVFTGRRAGDLGIPAGIPTLASLLAAAGYRTAAVSASPVVRARPSEINREGGFGAGFDLFLDGCRWRDARCVHRRAAALLDLLPEPFFLYLHDLDPHDPYAAPQDTATRDAAPARFAGPYAGDPAVAAGDPLPAAARLAQSGDAGLSAADLTHLRDRYDDEIAFVDERLGEWLDLLGRRGLLERSVLVVVSDHGESFLEHGHLRHCRSLYDEELRVPLIVRPPGGVAAPGRRVAGPATLLDVTPTLLDYAGVPTAGLELAGHSLRPWVEGNAPTAAAIPHDGGRRVQTASAAAGRVLVAGRWKLHYDLESGTAKLYDLARDPAERHDLAVERPAEAERLLALLDRHLRVVEGEGIEASAERLRRATEAERHLRSLGYLR